MIFDFKIINTDKEVLEDEIVNDYQFRFESSGPIFYGYFFEKRKGERNMFLGSKYGKDINESLNLTFSKGEIEEIKQIILNHPRYRLRNMMEKYEVIY